MCRLVERKVVLFGGIFVVVFVFMYVGCISRE